MYKDLIKDMPIRDDVTQNIIDRVLEEDGIINTRTVLNVMNGYFVIYAHNSKVALAAITLAHFDKTKPYEDFHHLMILDGVAKPVKGVMKVNSPVTGTLEPFEGTYEEMINIMADKIISECH